MIGKLKTLVGQLGSQLPSLKFLARMQGENNSTLFVHAENAERGWHYELEVDREDFDPAALATFLSRIFKREFNL